jgi:MFS family permease
VIVLVNTFTVDRFGRKALLVAGFAIQAAALLILSSLTTAFPDNTNKAAGVAEVAMLFIVGLTYCWSNGPITPAIASEIFPQEVRDKAFGLSLLGQTVCLLALTQPWPTFTGEVGGKSYWLLFGLNTLLLVGAPVCLCDPRRRGKAVSANSVLPRYLSSLYFPRQRVFPLREWTRSLARWTLWRLASRKGRTRWRPW